MATSVDMVSPIRCIILASGMGKSTLVAAYPQHFTDIDEYYTLFKMFDLQRNSNYIPNPEWTRLDNAVMQHIKSNHDRKSILLCHATTQAINISGIILRCFYPDDNFKSQIESNLTPDVGDARAAFRLSISGLNILEAKNYDGSICVHSYEETRIACLNCVSRYRVVYPLDHP